MVQLMEAGATCLTDQALLTATGNELDLVHDFARARDRTHCGTCGCHMPSPWAAVKGLPLLEHDPFLWCMHERRGSEQRAGSVWRRVVRRP